MKNLLSKAKGFLKEHKKVMAFAMAVMCTACMFAIPASAESTVTPVTFDQLQPVLDNLQAQINVATIIAVIAALVGAAVGLAFMWWGVRKLIRVIMAAFKKGKVSV